MREEGKYCRAPALSGPESFYVPGALCHVNNNDNRAIYWALAFCQAL